jgi:hypothetical protein
MRREASLSQEDREWLSHTFKEFANIFDELTEWEQDFVSSTESQYQATGYLTSNQRTKLTEVYERHL